MAVPSPFPGPFGRFRSLSSDPLEIAAYCDAVDREYRLAIAAIIRRALHDFPEVDWEAVVQESFLGFKIWVDTEIKARSDRLDPLNPYQWLFGTASHKIGDAKRKAIVRRRTDSGPETEMSPAPPPPPGEVEEDYADLNKALSALSADHRAVLEADARGWSDFEISDRLHIPVATVKTRLHRARKELRRVFLSISPNRSSF